jgi:hypothetical protein
LLCFALLCFALLCFALLWKRFGKNPQVKHANFDLVGSLLSRFIDDFPQYPTYDFDSQDPTSRFGIKPLFRGMMSGDIAPISTNILSLETLEGFEPELVPLYNVLRSSEDFQALDNDLNIGSEKVGPTRLTDSQICQLETTFDVLEEIALQEPTVGAFVIPKIGKPGLRFIVNGKPVNVQQWAPEKMPIPMLRETIRALQKLNFAVQFDAVSYFYQFPVKHNGFVLRRKRRCFRVKKMPMGWSFAPLIAQSTSNAILKETLKRVQLSGKVYTVAWIDNFILAGETLQDVETLKAAFLQVCHEVNVEVKPTEETDPQLFTFAGIEHDLRQHQFRPSRKTIGKDNSCTDILKMTARQLLQVCGHAMWQAYARSTPLCFYEEEMKLISRVVSYVVNEQRSWESTLRRILRKNDNLLLASLKSIAEDESWNSVSTFPEALGENTIYHTDASNDAWAFVEKSTGRGSQGFFNARGRSMPIFEKEAIALFALVLTLSQTSPSTNVDVGCDNMALVRAFDKGHSSNRCVNHILRKIFQLMITLKLQLKVRWISTKENKADKFTRNALICTLNVTKEAVRDTIVEAVTLKRGGSFGIGGGEALEATLEMFA